MGGNCYWCKLTGSLYGYLDWGTPCQHTIICKVDMYLNHYHTTHCKRYGITECTINQIVLGRFIRGPDDDSKESKHVALKQQIIIKLLCFDCHLYIFIVISNTSGCLALNIRGFIILRYITGSNTLLQCVSSCVYRLEGMLTNRIHIKTDEKVILVVYRDQARNWTTEKTQFDSHQVLKRFSLLPRIQTSTGAHPASRPKSTGGHFAQG